MAVFENRNLDQEFFYRLKSGEDVLWSFENARGSGGYQVMAWSGLVFAPFYYLLLWYFFVGAFSLAAVYRSVSSPAFWIASFLFALPMLGIIWLFLRQNRFAYAVTDRRVFVMNSFSPMIIQVFEPRHIKGIMAIGPADQGTVILDHLFSFESPWWENPRRLANIPDPYKVCALIEARVLNLVAEKPAA